MYLCILVRCGKQTSNGARLARSQRHIVVGPVGRTHQSTLRILDHQALEESDRRRGICDGQLETLTIEL